MSIPAFLRGATAAFVTVVLLQACSSGSEQVAGIDRGGAPVATAVGSSGTITGFGSIFVNGVEYDTASANIRIDGAAGTEADLRVGQVVTVTGTLDTGSTTRGKAQTVSFNAAVQGPVQTLDASGGSLSVLGQTIHISPTTSFGDSITPRSIAGLAVGDFVEISGFPQSSGALLATRIERKPAQELEVTGIMSAFDNTARQFRINALLVDFSQATLEGFNGASPANGDQVEVEAAAFGSSGALLATRVERRSGALVGSSNRAEVEGLVSRFTSASDFAVGGLPVTTSASTRYENGSAANLAVDVAVEVDGIVDAQGRIVAEEIEFRVESDLRVGGPVISVNVATGTLNIAGVEVATDVATRFEDRSAANLERFSLTNVNMGDYVEVRGYAAGNRLAATLFERDEPQSEVEVRGPATNLAAPELTVLGVRIMTGAGTEFRDESGLPISATAFFAAAASGRLVEISGQLAGNAIQAEEAELEN